MHLLTCAPEKTFKNMCSSIGIELASPSFRATAIVRPSQSRKVLFTIKGMLALLFRFYRKPISAWFPIRNVCKYISLRVNGFLFIPTYLLHQALFLIDTPVWNRHLVFVVFFNHYGLHLPVCPPLVSLDFSIMPRCVHL